MYLALTLNSFPGRDFWLGLPDWLSILKLEKSGTFQEGMSDLATNRSCLAPNFTFKTSQVPELSDVVKTKHSCFKDQYC